MAWTYQLNYFFNKVLWNETIFRDGKLRLPDEVSTDSANQSDNSAPMNLQMTISEYSSENVSSGRHTYTSTNSEETMNVHDVMSGGTLQVREDSQVDTSEQPSTTPGKSVDCELTVTSFGVATTGRPYKASDVDLRHTTTSTNSEETNNNHDVMSGGTLQMTEDSQVDTSERPSRTPWEGMDYDVSVTSYGGVATQYEASDNGSEFSIVTDMQHAQDPFTQEEGPPCSIDMRLLPARQHLARPLERQFSNISNCSDFEVMG